MGEGVQKSFSWTDPVRECECECAWWVTRNMSTVTKNMLTVTKNNLQENNFWTPAAAPPLSYHFYIWGSHMYHMDIVNHVAAALGPLSCPRWYFRKLFRHGTGRDNFKEISMLLKK